MPGPGFGRVDRDCSQLSILGSACADGGLKAPKGSFQFPGFDGAIQVLRGNTQAIVDQPAVRVFTGNSLTELLQGPRRGGVKCCVDVKELAGFIPQRPLVAGAGFEPATFWVMSPKRIGHLIDCAARVAI